ncbi:hypothetical protein [Pseudarthrobacter sp. W1I19]|uniref:hypothetical protein n=1 Tax=Pseudarthrobacter sp. W1I19 TaxID=3042288 RepID=UPI0027D822D7|nr:hypothetical protein [Pseudarthrobacter sp. W1I19]
MSSVTDKLAGPAPNVPAQAAPAPSPAAATPVGLLQPVVGQVSGLAENIVSPVPVVNQVVPAGTVTSVAVPIAQVADGATAAVVDAVVPPVAGTLPVLEPVLEPVSDLVTGPAPLPVELPEPPIAAVEEEVPATAAIVLTEASTAEQSTAETAAAAESSVAAAPDTAANPDGAVSLAGASAPLRATIGASDSSHDLHSTVDPSPAPAHAPAAPGSGTGSGSASAGSPGATAFLNPFTFDLSLPGAICADETPEHAPAPVSFDPGSSPD